MISYLLQVWFESDVIPDSGKTVYLAWPAYFQFESDVIPDSGKTKVSAFSSAFGFESDVIPDSGKTSKSVSKGNSSLRVM